MALENQILDRLVAITNTLNAIQANSKRTEEFPHLEPLDNDGKIRVSVDGVSFWIAISEISSLIDALGFDVINFGFDLANNTAGNSTTSQEIVDYINSIGFTVNTGNLIQLSIVVKKNDSYYIKKYNFRRNNITGNWGTGFANGEINISDLVETGEIFIGNVPSGGDDILFNLGDIGSDSIFAYLNNRNTSLDPYRNLLDDGSVYYFSAIINDDNQIYKYVGSLPKTVGQGQDVLVFYDFDLISNDATFTPTGGYTGTAQDIVDLFNNYLPLTGGTLTGPLSATNFETGKGIEFLSNIEISKLLASGELAVRITDTGVPIYIFNETGTPTNPKDVITKEFFDANAGGDNAPIEVTCDTAKNVNEKTGTTTAGNYVPTYGDLLYINFTKGSFTGAAPEISIDGSTSYPLQSGNITNIRPLFPNTGITPIKILFWFDGESYQAHGSYDTTNDGSLSTLITGTSNVYNRWRAADLTDWIDQKYVPMFGFKSETIVLSPLGEDLTIGLCEYIYTVQDDVLLVSYPTNVQSPSSGTAVETGIRRNGTEINPIVRSVIRAGQLDTFTGDGRDGVFDPPVQLTKGDKLSFFVYESGSTVLAQCLTVSLNFQ